ncbi:MAG TPA: polysaccharide biosynthesis/export family protein [Sphingomonas sp.]|nr:polysaccharide biosynthesis/export family protein [Sphingomonas sp.]
MKTWPIPVVILLASAPITQSLAATPPTTESYTINPGDEVEVYVWGDERLQRTIKILPDGSFSFPLVGRVIAQGAKPVDLEAEIAKKLAGQYQGKPPQVTVSVRGTGGYVFSVVGRVKSASTFAPGRYVNLIEAIAMAGGADEFANLDNVTIIRKTDKGLVATRVRMQGLMKGNLPGSLASTVPQIEVGDTVIVP